MKPTLQLTILLFFALHTAATPFADAQGEAANAAAADSKASGSVQYGAQGGEVILKTDAYLDVIPASVAKANADTIACAWAKVLAGKCGNAKPPDDAACTYIITCRKLPAPCGPGEDRPNSYRSLDGETMCSCPRSCDQVRVGFQKGPKPKDECTPEGKAAEGT
ncbi:uncharacterized protein J3D65DRAFT_671043 [Phyllosticta citribraziliensis]|uniref:Uncharacterized protein n=1 Tax=Phyllosticta citribraziliensis TaxID=989973 RepID=A0ABR1LB63_9PEZI